MNDETTKEIEDLSTLACSTDEVLRKLALVSMMSRVVGRSTLTSAQSVTPLGETFSELREDRDALVSETERLAATLRKAREERDTHKANAETLARELAEARAEVGRLRSLAGSQEKAGRVLTREEVERVSEGLYDAPTYPKALRWLEREGYLSVRLPPEE